MIQRLILLVGIVLFTFVSCTNTNKKEEKVVENSDLIEISSPDENEIIEIYQRFPSVDELLPSLIKKDFKYNQELPIAIGFEVATDSEVKKKNLLGFYLADIGYYNVFEKKTESLVGLKTFVELCEALKVSVKFDKGILQLMEHKSYGIDSLKNLSAKNYFLLLQSFEAESDVETIKALTGGMLIEILYLSLNSIVDDIQFANYMDLIAEQKSIIEHYLVYLNRLGNTGEESTTEKQIKRLYLILSQFEIDGEVDIEDTIKVLQRENLIFNEEVFYKFKNELNVLRGKYLE